MVLEWEDELPAAQRDWMKAYWKLGTLKTTDAMVAILEFYPDKQPQLEKFVQGRSINSPHGSLKTALKNCNPSTTTRIVMLVHDGHDRLDRNMVRTLWETFHLNPEFMMSHFFWEFKNYPPNNSYSSSTLGTVPVSLLPREDYLLLDYNGAQFGAIVPEVKTPRTVVMFASVRLWVCTDKCERPCLITKDNLQAPMAQYADVYLEPLLESKISPNGDLLDFITPYIRLINDLYGFQLRALRQRVNHGEFVKNYPERRLVHPFMVEKSGWRHFLRLRIHLARAKESLDEFSSQKKYNHCPKLGRLSRHYEDMNQQFADFQGWITFLLQEIAAQQGVETGRENTRQMFISNRIATSARAIATMAYIFVPLAFGISFFGMNLSIFGRAEVELKTFVGVVLGIWALGIVLAIAVYFMWEFLERWSQQRKADEEREARAVVQRDLEKQK